MNKGFLKTAMLSMAATGLTACMVDDTSGPAVENNGAGYSREKMVTDVTRTVIIPHYQTLASASQALTDAISAYCQDVTNTDKRAQAQTAWQTAATHWQYQKAFMVGPALETVADKTREIRIDNYSGGTKLNPIVLDTNMYYYQLSDKTLSVNDSGTSENILGFNALEYQLFTANPEQLAANLPDAQTAWAALANDTARIQTRCDFTLAISQRLTRDIEQLNTDWQNDSLTFIQAPDDGGFTQLSDALFFLDTLVKDVKLAQVLQLNDKCSNDRCADNAEARYAQISYRLIHANLAGVKAVFTGGEGLGFVDDYRIKGEMAAAENFIADIDRAMTTALALDEKPQSLYVFAQTIDPEQCENASAAPLSGDTPCHLHGQIKRITDKLKTEFATIVDTDIPNNAQGDGD